MKFEVSSSLFLVIHKIVLELVYAALPPPGRRVLLIAASAMFLLGTVAIVIAVAEAVISLQMEKAAVQGSHELSTLTRYELGLEVTEIIRLAINSVVADLLLLYRCYIIWGSNKKVVIIPAILILIPLVLFVVGQIQVLSGSAPSSVQAAVDIRTPFLIMMGTNVLLMLLTAGRICYTRRDAVVLGCGSFRRRYDVAIAMILESGSIYCFSVILFVICQTLDIRQALGLTASDSLIVFTGISSGFLRQTMNIAPTLILVRVGLTHCRWKPDASPSDTSVSTVRHSTDKSPKYLLWENV
ncbi:hypothetical protein MVEN_02328400 [Mycena venus]|uniref:Uncharacterized protein n=1 Tax=Mycena venus TaxID=2733690 RepID=A0A8H6X3E6_9AGAR|nr:hypothetical protein MVEN_02328400 [Mycena venus]